MPHAIIHLPENRGNISVHNFRSINFYNEPIEVQYDQIPLLEKKPGCPDSFTWRNHRHIIREVVSEWHDYRRHGKMARNMLPKHAEIAMTRGSRGVGQDYYRVRTDLDQVFDIYYDRAPKDVDNKKGSWFIYRELEEHIN